MKVIIDRFEGNYAVCEKEDRFMLNIEKSELPYGVKEGDVLLVNSKIIVVDENATEKQRK